MLRQPAREPAELDAFVLAQIIESEWSLWLQRQLWHQSQDFLLRCNMLRLSLPTSVCTSAWATSLYGPNWKWMYNGRVRGSLWYIISARSTPLGRSTDPWWKQIPVKPPTTPDTGISITPATGKALYKTTFSTVSLAHCRKKVFTGRWKNEKPKR